MCKPNQEKSNMEFPGSPVVSILHFYWRGHRFGPWMGELRSHVLRDMAKKKKKSFFNLEKIKGNKQTRTFYRWEKWNPEK